MVSAKGIWNNLDLAKLIELLASKKILKDQLNTFYDATSNVYTICKTGNYIFQQTYSAPGTA